MGQHTLRQARQEGVRGDLSPGALESLAGKLILVRRARPIASDVERHQAQQAGIFADIVAGEVKIRRDRLLPGLRAGPVLAQQGALVRRACIAQGKPMPWLAVKSRAGVSGPPITWQNCSWWPAP
jgi:hypothetical protein